MQILNQSDVIEGVATKHIKWQRPEMYSMQACKENALS